MIDKEPTSEKDKPTLKVEDDFSPLIQIYNSNPEDREKIISEHYQNSDRIGFGRISLEDYIQIIQAHFSENSTQYLEDEKNFLDKISHEDLINLLSKPIEKVGYFFPVTLDKPTIILLLNGMKTDGKMIDDDTFGINLQNLFRSYYNEEKRELDYQKIIREISTTQRQLS